MSGRRYDLGDGWAVQILRDELATRSAAEAAWEQHARTPRPPARLRGMKEVVDCIHDAAASGADPVEADEHFDRWKGLLDGLVEQLPAGQFAHHGEVLGLLLNAVHGRDLCDYRPAQLAALRDVTELLARPDIGTGDAQDAALRLVRAGVRSCAPVAARGEQDATSAEALVAELAGRYRG